MVEARSELMTFTRGDVSGDAEARAYATAAASAEIRRGLRAEFQASAGATFEARLTAAPDGTHADAVLSAEVAAGIRGAIAAQLDVRGLFAEAALGVEARAQIKGDLSVTGEVLFAALDVDLPPHIARPVRALLAHTQLHAGVFAEVYLAVKAQARLQVGGSMIPVDGSGASGITVNFRYGYAWIYGAGVRGYIDLEFPSAADALDALIQEVLVVLDELLPDDTPREVRTALRLVLPIAASAAVAVGRDLGAPRPTNDPGSSDLARVGSTLLAQLRSKALGHLLETLIRDAAERVVEELLGGAGLPVDERLFALGTEVIDDLATMVSRVRTSQSLVDALPPLVDAFGALARLGDGTLADPLRDLTTAATTAAVGGQVLLDLLGRPNHPLAPIVVARVRDRLTPPRLPDVGEPAVAHAFDPTLTTLVEYLVSISGVLGDDAAGTMQTVADVLGRTPETLIRWLWELGRSGTHPEADRATAAAVSQALVGGLERLVNPWVEGLPQGELRELAMFVRPLLEIVELALPLVLAPDLTNQGAARLRDQMDAQLTQLVGAATVRSLDHVVRPYFARGADQLRELADRVDRQDPAFAEFFAIANDVSALFRVDEVVVAAALRETADILHLVETSGFDSALGLLRAFVLLPENDAQRRAALAELSGTDKARIGDDALWAQLVEAMIADSTELAVGMIPPSLRMTTVIAIQQGPLPLLTVAHEAAVAARALGDAIAGAQQAGADVATMIEQLVTRGRVRADDLVGLADDLKRIIRALRQIVDAVLRVLREALWPVWVAATGGFGIFARGWYDQLFDEATNIVAEVERALDRLVDDMIGVVMSVARGLGVLDEGSGDDLGSLGAAVRQAAVGAPGAPGVTVTLGLVSTGMSRAELATHVTNSAFANPTVRDTLRSLHRTAAAQVADAVQIDALRRQGTQAGDTAQSLRDELATKSLPTGTAIDVSVEGLTAGQSVTGELTFVVSLPGSLGPLVTGASPLVRIEVGGAPVRVDPRIWGLDERGRVRCRIKLVCEQRLAASEVTQILTVEQAHITLRGSATPPVISASRRRLLVGASPTAPRAADFLPWAMVSTGTEPVVEPTVLAPQTPPRRPPTLLARGRFDLPEPEAAGFVSSLSLGADGLPAEMAGPVNRLRPRDPRPGEDGGGGGHVGVRVGAGGGAAGAGGGAGGRGGGVTPPPPGLPYSAVALVPPGFVTVSVAVAAAPGPGQTPETTPKAVVTTWCIVRPA